MRLERVTDRRELPATDDAPLHKCIALTVDPVTGSFACSIYATRPQVCRDLERGGGACRGELATKGERPLRALAMLRG